MERRLMRTLIQKRNVGVNHFPATATRLGGVSKKTRTPEIKLFLVREANFVSITCAVADHLSVSVSSHQPVSTTIAGSCVALWMI